jgi:hypothetical protein
LGWRNRRSRELFCLRFGTPILAVEGQKRHCRAGGAPCIAGADAGPYGDNTAQFPSNSDLKSLTTSGSYLAARHARVERDAASAAAFYRSALRTDPKNNELLDRAFISSLAEGDIDEAVKLGPGSRRGPCRLPGAAG